MTEADRGYSRRWLILVVSGVARVMVVLDTTVGKPPFSNTIAIY